MRKIFIIVKLMKKRKVLIITLIVVIAAIVIGGILVAINIHKNKINEAKINDFSDYVLDEKDDFNKLILGNNEGEYEKLISV